MIYRPLFTIDPVKYRGGFDSARYNLHHNQFLANIKRVYTILDAHQSAIDHDLNVCIAPAEFDPITRQLDGAALTMTGYENLHRRLGVIQDTLNMMKRSV